MIKKKNKFKGVSIILTASVIALNFLGLSYAHWNNDLEIMTTITTAKFESKFQNANIQGGKGNNDLKIYMDKDLIRITGDVEHDASLGRLKYMIKNESDIPVKIILPSGEIINLSEQNGSDKFTLPLEENLYYQIICEQGPK